MKDDLNMLEVKDLTLFYENAIAINNANLLVRQGKINSLFGSNSAGKSSFMYCVSGIILDVIKKEKLKGGSKITIWGEIKFQGEDILNLKPSTRAKKGIILCPERRIIFDESTTLENLKIGGFLATRTQARKTLEYIFELFPDLVKLKRKEGGFLSGGEQQMLAIGRALMAQPKLLLLDEPLLGLAPIVETRLVRAIRTINKEIGITVLIAEQYARPVIPITYYGYVFENGSIVTEGTKEALMDNPDVKEAYFGI